MQLIKELFSVNEILTVSIVSWFVAQVLKTIINFILLGKFQLERMWGDGGMPSSHSATVCAMVIAAARSEGISSAIFAVASVVAIITMHDAMGVRHETGEQAKVLNQMIEEWIDISEKNAPFLQNMHLKEMVGHTPLQVMAGMVVGVVVGFFALVSVYAFFDDAPAVLDLSLSFMIVGLVGLLITRIANWRFLKHNPNYRKKRLAATTRRRWPWGK